MIKRMVRDSVLRVVGRAMASPIGRPVVTRFYRSRDAIVFYHAVWRRGDDRQRLFGGVELERFRRDLRELARVFEFVSVAQLIAEPGDAAAPPRVAVTFDDGFDLTAGGATDVMDALGVRATVFVNTQSVDYQRLMWQHALSAIRGRRGEVRFVDAFNRLQGRVGQPGTIERFTEQIRHTRCWPTHQRAAWIDELWADCAMPPMSELMNNTRPYLDWPGLRDWMSRGHAVGCHTDSHPFCSRLKDDEIDGELLAPSRRLCDELGMDAVQFAYPFGDRLDDRREHDAWSTGLFTCMLGTDRVSMHGEPPMSIDRVEVTDGVPIDVFARPWVRAMRGRTGSET